MGPNGRLLKILSWPSIALKAVAETLAGSLNHQLLLRRVKKLGLTQTEADQRRERRQVASRAVMVSEAKTASGQRKTLRLSAQKGMQFSAGKQMSWTLEVLKGEVCFLAFRPGQNSQ